MKKLLLLLALCCCSGLFAQYHFVCERTKVDPSAEGVYLFKNGGWFKTVEIIEIDPAKKYRFTAEARLAPGATAEKGRFYVGIAGIQKNGIEIKTKYVNPYSSKLTTLVQDAKVGDTSVILAHIDTWKSYDKYSYCAFNAKENYSDLPNMTVEDAGVITAVEKVDNGYKVTFKTPLKVAYPAGTKVRQQRDGATYLYVNAAKLPRALAQWVPFTHIIQGVGGCGSTKFWVGTAKIKIAVCINNEKPFGTQPIELRNIKLEEIAE